MAELNVNIRMYRVGELGDCFLLSFKEGEKESNVLIDCGSFRNSKESVSRMKEIAGHIKSSLSASGTNLPLQVVVGTHQHNDHLSGFVHGKDIFKDITCNQVWLSWLDKPTDKQATDIANGQRKLAAKLQDVAIEMGKIAHMQDAEELQTIKDVLGFYAIDGPTDKKTPLVPQLGIDLLKKMGAVSYLEPGNSLDLPGLDRGSVRVHVLGPPRDNNHLFDITPGKGESYDSHIAAATAMAEGFFSALTNFTDGPPDEDEPFFPFDQHYEQKTSSSDFIKKQYEDKKHDWRKIDEAWLGQAELLALYLDSYTNNSSLVLAFEMVRSGKVLLFVGDAQTGNWLSWKDIKWRKNDTMLNDLLARTVLYKVGHHGSHNATLPEYLEKMTHPELVAMIPVDSSDPNIMRPKHGWKMPAINLYSRLKGLTEGKILRMDCNYGTDCGPAMTNATKKWGVLKDNVTVDPGGLFIDYTIKG
jgi:beta-lactamase superfamily II metal-dependent hydrolase